MKRLLIIVLLILISYSNSNSLIAKADSSYARIENTTELFKSNSIDTSLENILCLIEETYFVEIIADYDTLYKVSYNGVTGFVKKSAVKKISDTPTTAYPYNIKIVMNSNCNLRATPTTKSQANNVISTIYTNSNDIAFIGRAIGEEAIDFGGNTWYFVCYNGEYGYIYNNYVKSITPIYKNTEQVTYLEEISATSTNPITHTPSILIMIILSIPLILVLIILYLPNNHKKTKSTKQKIIKEIERY